MTHRLLLSADLQLWRCQEAYFSTEVGEILRRILSSFYWATALTTLCNTWWMFCCFYCGLSYTFIYFFTFAFSYFIVYCSQNVLFLNCTEMTAPIKILKLQTTKIFQQFSLNWPLHMIFTCIQCNSNLLWIDFSVSVFYLYSTTDSVQIKKIPHESKMTARVRC